MCHAEVSAADVSVTNSQRRTDCLPRDWCEAGQSINIGNRVCNHYTETPSDDIRNVTVVKATPVERTRKHS
uniref:DUF1540 domain-containing protein n=1 Tax=Panagrellus redivivus TaxID=6233 RepID=A0A7E4UW22_PANRE